MNDYPIRVGSMLFTMVDPERGHEVAYNRWYERDHFYAGCMVGPWLFAGKRWVATRELKDLRFSAESPVAVPVDAGSYLAVYWVHEGHHGDHFRWARRQVFELSLDHHFRGLAVVAVDPADGVDTDDLDAHLRGSALPALMNDSPVASMVSWSYIDSSRGDTKNTPMDLGTPPGPPERQLQLFFIDDEPGLPTWDRFRDYSSGLAASGKGSVVFAAPFLPTAVGTDEYTSELW